MSNTNKQIIDDRCRALYEAAESCKLSDKRAFEEFPLATGNFLYDT